MGMTRIQLELPERRLLELEKLMEETGVATKKDEFAGAAVAEFAEPFGKGVRIETFPTGVEEHHGGGALGVELLASGIGVANFGDFHGTRSADAFDIIIEESADFRAADLAEHKDVQLHFKPYFLRFSRSVLRLMPRASAERLIW